VIPAYRRLARYLETLRSKALRNDGVWALAGRRPVLPARDRVEHDDPDDRGPDPRARPERGRAPQGRDDTRVSTAPAIAKARSSERFRRLGDSPGSATDSDEGRARILSDYQSIIDEISAGWTAISA
jgi:hypothetical protein